MKRREFLTNTALLGTGVTLGLGTVLSSCSRSERKHTPEQLGMFSFVDKAPGYDGRARRLTGDIFDFFSVDYRYPNNKRMLATARQIDGCDTDISESVMGTDGVCYLQGGNIRIEDFKGDVKWKYNYEEKPFNNPYLQEHIHFVESVRLNKKINQFEELANSTMVAIMGRESAYTGRPITWDEIMASELRYGPTE